jgi:hypothetical protein
MNVLDVPSAVETIQLDNQFQHCTLYFIITTSTVIESSSTLRKETGR